MKKYLRPAAAAVLALATLGVAGPALAQTAATGAKLPVACTVRWQDRTAARANVAALAAVRSGPSTQCLLVGRGRVTGAGLDCWTSVTGSGTWWHVTLPSGVARSGWVRSSDLSPVVLTTATRCA